MRNELIQTRIFSRRALILGGAQLFTYSILMGKLYYLQVLRSGTYKTLSDDNRIKIKLLPPLRGQILDRFGNIIATNQNDHRLLFDMAATKEPLITLEKLISHISIDNAKKHHILQKARKHTSHAPLLIHDQLSWEDIARIEVNTLDLPGVSIETGQNRYYPFDSLYAHIVGYTGVSSRPTKSPSFRSWHPLFKVGKSGIEKTFDTLLRGQAGLQRIEVNAYGTTVQEISREKSTPGHDLSLTIDSRIQASATSLLKTKVGALVVMDISNGHILAMVSTPSFNPNQFTHGTSQQYWNNLVSNQHHPLINRTISQMYPPASTFKLVVALAALQKGFSPHTSFYCSGHVTSGNRTFHCWKREGHGKLNLYQALTHSCNSYFYEISKQIGIEYIAKTAQMLGLGTPSGITLPGELGGLIPTKAWKKKRIDEDWKVGDTLNSSIGQGYVLTTPLQLAVMVARIANGKEKVLPTLHIPTPNIDHDIAPKHEPFEPLDIDPSHLQVIRKGMTHVVNHPAGTAYKSRIEEAPFSMAGKTGTSQVISQTHEKKSDAWSNQHHGLFVGYGPARSPRYACSVIIEHGGSGSRSAAPIAKEILLYTQKLYASS